MDTRVIPMDDPRALADAVSCLWGGEIVAFPAETCYALAVCATMPVAVNKLFVIKGLQRSRSLPLFIRTPQDLPRVAENVPAIAYQLARRFWPGRLTLVLHRSSRIPPLASGGHDTVSVRMPAHPGALSLLRAAGCALAVSGANLAGLPSPLTPVDAALQLSSRISLILDGGRCQGGQDSTVVDLTGERPRLVRLGAISPAALRTVIPELIEDGDVARAEYARVR